MPGFRCERCAILDILDGHEPEEAMEEYLRASSSYDSVMAAIRYMQR
jgi:hypothetical protein